jgi:hypothetical protein
LIVGSFGKVKILLLVQELIFSLNEYFDTVGKFGQYSTADQVFQ